METKDYLRVIHEEIHSTVVATVDAEGHPVTRVIDMMLHDDSSLYFLTARGKVFYEQLMEQKFIAISGMTGGEGSMSKKAVSVRGKVRNIGKEKLDEIFERKAVWHWKFSRFTKVRENTLTSLRSQLREEASHWEEQSAYQVDM